LRHSVNLGKGAALRTGMQAAAQSVRWAVTLDADGQHRPQDAANLLREAAAHSAPAIVLGCRLGMDAESVPKTSRMGRWFSNVWVWAAGGPRVSDSQTGFRMYPLPEVLELPAFANRFQFEVEVLVLAHRAGLPVREASVTAIYELPGGRISHFRPFRDFCRNATTFTALIVGRLFGRRPQRIAHATGIGRLRP